MNLLSDKDIHCLCELFKTKKENINPIKQLFGGMSNKVYLVEIDNKLYTYRIPGFNSHLFVDRKEELKAIKIGNELGITSDTIYFSYDTGVKVSKYIDGIVLTEINCFDYLVEIADTLKMLHNMEVKNIKKYGLLERLDKYESYNDKIEPLYFINKDFWIQEYNEKFKETKLVFCHGDAQRSNFVKGENRLYLFDYEYSSLNDPYYDIASFGNVSFDDSVQLLKIYLGYNPRNEELAKLMFYRIYQTLQWYQVAKYKHVIGLGKDLKLDFEQIAARYLHIASTLINQYKKITGE